MENLFSTMMDKLQALSKLKREIVLVILIISALSLVTTTGGKNFIIRSLGGYTEKLVETKIDTLEIKVDTTRIINEWLEINANLLKPISVNTYTIQDTLIIKDSIIIVENEAYIKTFQNPVSDSLLVGNITTSVDFGTNTLLSQKLDYTPKFPIIITKTIPIKETVTTTLSNNYKIGAGIHINNLGDINLLGAYQKKGWQYQLNYELVSTNEIKTVGLGIIKFF